MGRGDYTKSGLSVIDMWNHNQLALVFKSQVVH